ncbi:hypothetical protein A2810_01825 [candidate division Kazan bacterium RIFCSPHIGHO2_01_FULL_49_10]|uniref:GIY-YIG domain-containing protein n=1 Tax=candidate division Kazan bacterium RIFCSPLOWO2_01_FULL_48_13 TaxID=1798539 RepID=A0A1F4PNZ9_UNCK3|nr:MAG: hypothetical protein A2810_01825 [candidate division Kazan bacterium RIFCSPHIGHO2_01_FULL_49_10]OGB85378.1 MAG: hypothetical protein A2994_02000 [candidate division Kazan bacterium RIFCSPLOWO2_01_FULL_48_13]
MLNLFQHLGMKKGYIYILTNKPRGVLYTGVTSTLIHRLDQHANTVEPTFTKRYRLHRLVHIEEFPSIVGAVTREKQLKNWHRQ